MAEIAAPPSVPSVPTLPHLPRRLCPRATTGIQTIAIQHATRHNRLVQRARVKLFFVAECISVPFVARTTKSGSLRAMRRSHHPCVSVYASWTLPYIHMRHAERVQSEPGTMVRWMLKETSVAAPGPQRPSVVAG